jgi:hypothetical protein
MTKKNWALILIALALAVVYAIYFTDWFKPKTIQIVHTSRTLRPRSMQANAQPNLIFGLNRAYRLTEIKVVPLAEFQTNPNALPLWHLVSSSNSAPVKIFGYGQKIRGMNSAVPGAHPQPLESNIVYRLLLTAGKFTGQHDFELGGKPPDAANPAGN